MPTCPDHFLKGERNMPKRFGNIPGYLALLALLASACQPAPAVNATETPIPATETESSTRVPATLSPTVTISPEPLWSFQTQGAIWGNPSVNDGTVYVGSDDGNLYAIAAQTGELKWQFATQGIVRSEPAIEVGMVIFASDDGFLYAVNSQNGIQAWHTDIGNALSREVREKLGTSPDPSGFDYKQSSPIVANGQVYVGSMDGNLYALDANSGHVSWRYQTGGNVRATPVLDNGILYVGSWDKYFYALDAQTGHLRWKKFVGGEVQSTALVDNGMVYTASRKASVVALDAQSGENRWEFSYGTNNWVESSPILNNGIIYVGSSMYKVVIGLDSQTGTISTWFDSKAMHWSKPAILDNMLYIGGEWATKDVDSIGGLYGLSLLDDKFASFDHAQWYFPVSRTLEPEGIFYGVASSPVIISGIIYFGGLDGKLYAVNASP
jgi:eukaryotic-like serine/threonine-protein kinase